jgi:transposase InsO family protein
MREGRVYLTMVLDLFDRKVIGWALSADMDSAHKVIPATDRAFRNHHASAGLYFIPTGVCGIARHRSGTV